MRNIVLLFCGQFWNLKKGAAQLVVPLAPRHGSWGFRKAILGSFTGVSKRMMHDPLRCNRVGADLNLEMGDLFLTLSVS